MPEDESKSLAVKEAAPFVEPSAAASWIDRVEPENESGEETVVFWTKPVPESESSPEPTLR